MSSIRRRLTFPALFVLLGATVAVIGGAAPAAAYCYYGAKPLSFFHNGYMRARENVQYSSTCDGDSIYKGKAQDSVTDGHCAKVEVWDEPIKSTPVTACTTGAWVNYTYWDQQGNSAALMRLCYGGTCGPYYWFYGH